jgi:hypothetical protein
MKTKTLLILNGVAGVFFGLSYLLMPDMQMEMFGLQSSDAANLLMQAAGAAYVGYGLMAFALMNITDAASTKMVTLGFMGAWICTTAMDLYSVATGAVNSSAWVGVIVGLFFVVMYGMKRFGK